MAPPNSFYADSGIDDTSGVFGTCPAPDEPLFLSALPSRTPPPLDSRVDRRDDFFTAALDGLEQKHALPQSDPTSFLSLPQTVDETQATDDEVDVSSPAPQAVPSSQIKAAPRRPTRRPSSISMPDIQQQATNRQKRRKSVADIDCKAEDEFGSPERPSDECTAMGSRTVHNMIEKRYRTNLNQKIAALRDVVPSLCVTNGNYRGEEGRGEDLDGPTPVHKPNKATVLSKATEYIAHLEQRSKALRQENNALKARIDAFEIMVPARQGVASKQNAAMEIKQAGSW